MIYLEQTLFVVWSPMESLIKQWSKMQVRLASENYQHQNSPFQRKRKPMVAQLKVQKLMEAMKIY